MKKWLIVAMVAVTFQSCFDKSEDPNGPLNAELAQIDERLQQLGLTDNVLYDNTNGFRFVIGNYGEGAPPHNGQKVKVTNVQGRLFSDNSVFTTGDINLKLDEINPEGLRYAIGALMKGTVATVYVPSKYGYGTAGTTNVPPNSILVYDLTLEDVERTTSEQVQFEKDTAAIHKFITDNSIADAIQHESGIWYTIEEEGTGVSPNPYDVATFDYDLSLLTSPDTKIPQGTPTLTDVNIFGLIDGFKIGLPLIRVGTKATFYVPSVLAYGTRTDINNIPANSNLIFKVTLKSIKQ